MLVGSNGDVQYENGSTPRSCHAFVLFSAICTPFTAATTQT